MQLAMDFILVELFPDMSVEKLLHIGRRFLLHDSKLSVVLFLGSPYLSSANSAFPFVIFRFRTCPLYLKNKGMSSL